MSSSAHYLPLYMQLRSSLRHVTEEPLQPIAGNGLPGRKNSQEKKLRKSMESVAVTASTTANGGIQQSLPQLERGGVTGEWYLHWSSVFSWPENADSRPMAPMIRSGRICQGNSGLHASFGAVCTYIQPYLVCWEYWI